MPASVTLETVHPRKLAVVRRTVAPGTVASAWRPALDTVWNFLHSRPGLWTRGHNVFLYHRPEQRGAPIQCEFGVEVTRRFKTDGEVYATETPAGEAAVAVYHGPYDRLHDAYRAIDEWIAATGRNPSTKSWEVYGDPTPNPADTETIVVQLLT